ncbi:MAG: hypothetical protein J3K34DRAFT_416043 [Monoraphidium minutum]|nr:MAG: hypothetical protein J3K34DRAFT_416043 [Monoraphidium minutum]
MRRVAAAGQRAIGKTALRGGASSRAGRRGCGCRQSQGLIPGPMKQWRGGSRVPPRALCMGAARSPCDHARALLRACALACAIRRGNNRLCLVGRICNTSVACAASGVVRGACAADGAGDWVHHGAGAAVAVKGSQHGAKHARVIRERRPRLPRRRQLHLPRAHDRRARGHVRRPRLVVIARRRAGRAHAQVVGVAAAQPHADAVERGDAGPAVGHLDRARQQQPAGPRVGRHLAAGLDGERAAQRHDRAERRHRGGVGRREPPRNRGLIWEIWARVLRERLEQLHDGVVARPRLGRRRGDGGLVRFVARRGVLGLVLPERLCARHRLLLLLLLLLLRPRQEAPCARGGRACRRAAAGGGGGVDRRDAVAIPSRCVPEGHRHAHTVCRTNAAVTLLCAPAHLARSSPAPAASEAPPRRGPRDRAPGAPCSGVEAFYALLRVRFAAGGAWRPWHARNAASPRSKGGLHGFEWWNVAPSASVFVLWWQERLSVWFIN